MPKPYILYQQDLDEWSQTRAGGKGQALAVLWKAKIPVPEAICITVDAYKAFIQQKSAQEAIYSASITPQSEPLLESSKLSDEGIQQALLQVPIPEEIAATILEAYAHFKAKYSSNITVAIRSSATSEDLPEASFAGQHETFLGISDEEGVLDAVRRCWASLWSGRAWAYRETQQINHTQVAMAVILQKMVQANISGVLFTTNPLTNDPSQMMINATWGLGEALVSGIVTPDMFILDKKSGSVISKTIANKQVQTVEKQGKVDIVAVPAHKAQKLALSSRQLKSLWMIGHNLEKIFGQPQDIEWSIEGNSLFVLQSRPITTIPSTGSAPHQIDPASFGKGYWTRFGFGDWMQLPLSPLFATYVLPFFNRASDALVQQRLGIRRTQPTWQVVQGYFYTRGSAVASLKLLALPLRFWQILQRSDSEWTQQIIPSHVQRIRALQTLRFQTTPASEILNQFDRICEANAIAWSWIILTGVPAKLSETVFGRLYQRIVHEANEITYATYLSGFSNTSIDTDEELWQLAEEARSQTKISTILLQHSATESLAMLKTSLTEHDWYDRFYAWLREYGHRVFDLDVLYETPQDNPAIAMQMIRRYLENVSPSPMSRQQQQTQIRIAAEHTLRNLLAHKPLRRWLLFRSLHVAQRYAMIRESRPFYLQLGWPLMHQAAQEIGQRLVEHHILETATDIFFLTAEEFRFSAQWLEERYSPFVQTNIKTSVHERKFLWEEQHHISPPKHIHPSVLLRFVIRRFLTPVQKKGDALHLSGTAGSPGIAQGRARVIRTSEDFATFVQGEILVAPFTTPAWTPILSLAAGIVTENGGALSHAAVIAREYGVPAVLGVPDAIGRIPQGTLLQVNGQTGQITILEEA